MLYIPITLQFFSFLKRANKAKENSLPPPGFRIAGSKHWEPWCMEHFWGNPQCMIFEHGQQGTRGYRHMNHSNHQLELFTNPSSGKLFKSLKKLQTLNANENPNWVFLISNQEALSKSVKGSPFSSCFRCSSLRLTQPFQWECFSKWDALMESRCWFQIYYHVWLIL